MNLVARTAIAVGTVSTVILAVVAVAGYLVVRDRTVEAEELKAKVKAQAVAARVESRLLQAVQSIESLSRNLVIRNALLDSAGRETYVKPILDDVAQIDGQPMPLSLVDYLGRPLIDAGPAAGTSPAEQAWLRERIESGAPGARTMPDRTAPESVVIAYPVLLPNTASGEGALAIRVSFRSLLAALGGDGESYHLVSTLASPTTESAAQNPQGVVIALHLPPLLGRLGLALDAQIDRRSAELALARLQIQYLSFGLVSVVAMVMLSIYAARRVTLPIRRLAAMAQRISSQGLAEATLEVPPPTPGEVGVLAQSLVRMLDRLREAAATQRRSLETQFRVIFDGMMDGAVITNEHGVIESANPSVARLFGHAQGDLVGRDVSDLLQPAEAGAPGDAAWPLASAVRQRHAAVPVEVAGRHRSGAPLPIEWSSDEFTSDGRRMFIVMLRDISERKAAAAALRASEERYRRIVETAREGIWVMDENHRTTLANARMGEMLGCDAAELIGTSMFEHMDEQGRAAAAANVEHRHRGSVEQQEFAFRRADGSTVWTLVSTNALTDTQGRYTGALAMVTDITLRRRAEEQVRTALHEREVLLKEIYHRVKNNLQVVASLLDLQARKSGGSSARGLLQDSANRVKSMAIVHEQLYQRGDLSSIDFAVYLRQLTGYLGDAYGDVASRVPIRVDAESVLLGIETATPLGLIVNELISNAYKHAYPDDRTGAVCLQLKTLANGQVELVVSDNGAGLAAGFKPEEATSLGMRLVVLLTEQLDGTLSHDSRLGAGTRFSVRWIPERPEPRRLVA